MQQHQNVLDLYCHVYLLFISEMIMYYLGSQENTDGTLKLVHSNQVCLHRCGRLMRDTAVTHGEQQQREGSSCQNLVRESHVEKAVMNSLSRTYNLRLWDAVSLR